MHTQNIVALIASCNPLMQTTPATMRKMAELLNSDDPRAWLKAPKHARAKVKEYMSSYFSPEYDKDEKNNL